MKTLQFIFIGKDLMSALRKQDKELSESFYEDVTSTKGINAHYVKYPFVVAGWYIEDNKAGKAFTASWEDAFDEATAETVDPTPTAKPAKKAAKADRGSILQEYATLSNQPKKSAKDKARIKVIEAELIS